MIDDESKDQQHDPYDDESMDRSESYLQRKPRDDPRYDEKHPEYVQQMHDVFLAIC